MFYPAMSSHTDSLKNIIENRKAINSKILNVLASEEKYSNVNYSPANFNANHKNRRFNRYENERPDFVNPFSAGRPFFPRNPPPPFFKFPKKYPKSYRRAYKFAMNTFPQRGPFTENFCPKRWRNRKRRYEQNSNVNNYENLDGEWNANKVYEVPNNEDKANANNDASPNGVSSYCLDRDTQHTIHRIQNDFRLTDKYKAFVLNEVPLIDEFKPMPVTTINKMNDRFKCFFRQILHENKQNYGSNEENNFNDLPENPEDDTLEICANLTEEANAGSSKV